MIPFKDGSPKGIMYTSAMEMAQVIHGTGFHLQKLALS